MDHERAIRLRRFAERYTAAWCSQDPASTAAFFAPNGSLTINGGAPAVGRAAITESARGFMTAFPDMVVLLDDLLDLGDRVVYRWTLVGTNTGPGGTGRRVRIRGFEDWRLGDDGLVAESQGHFDAAEYQRQLEQGTVGSASDDPAGVDDAGAAIAAVNAALDRALVEGTPEDCAALFTADALLGESGMADVVGRAAITAFLARGNVVRAVTAHRVHRDELIVLGDRAIEFGWFDERKLPHGGKPVTERGRIVTDWRREPDRTWRIARLVISDLPVG